MSETKSIKLLDSDKALGVMMFSAVCICLSALAISIRSYRENLIPTETVQKKFDVQITNLKRKGYAPAESDMLNYKAKSCALQGKVLDAVIMDRGIILAKCVNQEELMRK